MKRFFYLALFLFLLAIPPVQAHNHPYYFPEMISLDMVSLLPIEGQITWWLWGIHDRIHWIFAILMLYTCYHFRFWKGRKTHPKACYLGKDPGYRGENSLDGYHRYFWYANVILLLIHWSEVLAGLQNGIEYSYVFTFQLPGIAFEVFYVAAFSLWLLSCHFFRYLGGGCSACTGLRNKSFSWISRMNERHGIFMWIAIISFALLLLVEGHL